MFLQYKTVDLTTFSGILYKTCKIILFAGNAILKVFFCCNKQSINDITLYILNYCREKVCGAPLFQLARLVFFRTCDKYYFCTFEWVYFYALFFKQLILRECIISLENSLAVSTFLIFVSFYLLGEF